MAMEVANEDRAADQGDRRLRRRHFEWDTAVRWRLRRDRPERKWPAQRDGWLALGRGEGEIGENTRNHPDSWLAPRIAHPVHPLLESSSQGIALRAVHL